MKKIWAIFVFLHLSLVQSSLACNGHDITLTEISKCDTSDQSYRISVDFDLKFTKDCFLVITGCIYYKGFSSAMLDISMKKGKENMFNHTEDLCKSNLLVAECPIEQGKRCFRNNELRVSIKPFRRLLSTMVGPYEVDYTVRHDKGSSCGKVKFRIVKK